MRKSIAFSTLTAIVALFNLSSQAQVCQNACPNLFTLNDTINCNRFIEIRNINPGPGPSYTNNPFLIRTCQNSLMKYTLDVDPTCYAGTVYNFVSVSGGTFISLIGNAFTIQWGGASTGQVQIGFTTPGQDPNLPSCSDTMVLNFSLVPGPIAAFTASPQPVCNSNPTTINFNSSASVNANGYFWDFGDGFTSVLPNPSHAYANPGTYTVTLVASNSGMLNGSPVCPTCVDTAQQNITIDVLPSHAIECVATVCSGDTSTYCTPDNTCTNYFWSVTGGTIIGGQGTSCITVVWGSGSPQGYITLNPSGCATTYCPTGATVSVPIIPATATISGPAVVCNPANASYSLSSWPGTSYSWTLSNGGTIAPANTNTNQINVNWNTLGTHTLTCSYFDTSLNCGGNATYIVSVLPTLSISGPATVCQGETTNLNAFIPTNVPMPSNWTISPATATINSGNGSPAINVTWTTAGSYVVTATSLVPNSTCNNASYTVTVLAAPVISNINGADSVCENSTHVYSAVSNSNGLFTWTINGASSVSYLGVNNDSVQVTWSSTGPYNLSVSQVSNPQGCLSNTFVKNVYPWPTPILSGPTTVCADASVNYTITNIANANLQWSVSPSNFGTIISGQGTNAATILWHGNNSPGSSNTVYLKYGVCGTDSVAITINEPTALTITQSGTLCGPGGVTLSTGATGVFTWTGPGVPPPGNTSSITGITIPGNYSVQVQNYNGTGCTVTANYTIPDVGRPVASISADNVLEYCLPNLPNMNLVAVNGPGYTFQWYQAPNILLPGETNPTLAINSLTNPGSYSYYCVVTLGGCVLTSNTITITITTCSGGGCTAAINVTNIAGCNPFTLTIAATAPPGAVLNGTGNPTITHLEDNYIVNGLTTRTYTSIGYKQIRVCADVLLPDNSVCRVCKDTVVHVTVAADFTSVVNCSKINLYDASTVVAPATISSYSWSVGTNPGNIPVPPAIAFFDNNTIPNPVLTITQSGSYIVNHTITSGTCNVTVRDTFNISVPDASFNFVNSCVGTPVTFTDPVSEPVHFWDFGDASTSYVNPTSHSYSAAGSYSVTHIVTDVNGCKDTTVNMITINPAPVCTVVASGPLTFCYKDSVFLSSSCPGLTNFQWYNNGVPIGGAVYSIDTVIQTGNYHFVAYDVNGCLVRSDTVAVNVIQGPNVNISTSGTGCNFTNYTVSVPYCPGCTYTWKVDGTPVGNSQVYVGTVGFAPYTLGTHNIFIQVTNSSGCTDTSSINVTFNAPPTLSISVSGPSPVCSNNLYTLTANSSAASPIWSWYLNINTFIVGSTSTITASANGTYVVSVVDGVTGCRAQASQQIQRSPLLNLFPAGCDTLCSTSNVFLPLASLNNNLTGYSIDWFNNAPPYSPVIGNGVSLPLSSLPLGNHNLSVIVTAPNGCKDTSSVYSINIINCQATLPIKGLTIKALQTGHLALVNWSVEQEIDNDYFIVEKSYNGSDFVFLQKVMSRGDSYTKQYYSIYDTISISNGTVFYRIKAVDELGAISFSPIAKLKLSSINNESIMLLPNVTKGEVNMLIQVNASINSLLQVYSADGVLVSSRSLGLVKGLNKQTLDFSYLPTGIYIVRVRTANGQLTARLIRQ